jgi:transposase
MSKTWIRHLMTSAIVVLVNEFKTSKGCSECHLELLQKGHCFRVKRCTNSACSRSFWNRDVNAAINILKLFLRAASDPKSRKKNTSLKDPASKIRPPFFRKKEQCDE